MLGGGKRGKKGVYRALGHLDIYSIYTNVYIACRKGCRKGVEKERERVGLAERWINTLIIYNSSSSLWRVTAVLPLEKRR
jgi:hypothetical protein